ncbi:glucose-6-phosphate dehydrogenase [Streptomyces sp. NPDC059814]|uniref:glucose-6-phosphate dehydrogenase n=1 Tax=Streptomyces sp. NPDC059814 TaxID=3346959 RepID=UPI00365E96B9
MTTIPERADALTLFGITGDLAKKMLLPALYNLTAQGALDTPVIGIGRKDWSRTKLHQHARDALVAAQLPIDEVMFTKFTGLLDYTRIDYGDQSTFDALAAKARGHGRLAHYVAVPPSAYVTIAQRLAAAGLADNARLIVEKPFGHDLDSARALQAELTQHFSEEQLRRVDHFLGKDAVENLLTFRFANTMLTDLLTRRHVRGVQITMAEDFDVAGRGGFYDATGCLRDVVQNHLLQMFAYLVMDAPRTGSATDILDERDRALRATRTVRPDDCVRGQYTGYLDVPGVEADSTTETYVALRTWVDNERWSGVSFVIRAGKALATTAIEIVAELDRPIPGYFHTAYAQEVRGNLVRFRISPSTGVTFDLLAQHGSTTTVDDVAATADFTHLTGTDIGAYEHILADSITGDPRRFTRMDMVEECWRIIGRLLTPTGPPLTYSPGSWGPTEATTLTTDGNWHPLEQAATDSSTRPPAP